MKPKFGRHGKNKGNKIVNKGCRIDGKSQCRISKKGNSYTRKV